MSRAARRWATSVATPTPPGSPGLDVGIVSAAKKAGVAYVDVYERTLGSIARYEEWAADKAGVTPVATALATQARLTRDLAKVSARVSRRLLT